MKSIKMFLTAALLALAAAPLAIGAEDDIIPSGQEKSDSVCISCGSQAACPFRSNGYKKTTDRVKSDTVVTCTGVQAAGSIEAEDNTKTSDLKKSDTVTFYAGVQKTGSLKEENDKKTSERKKATATGFYTGIQAAGSFGACTFRSVSEGNFNLDFDGGILFGYRFSKVFSLQFEAVAGQAKMKSLECCDNYVLLYRERVGGDCTLEHDYFLKDRPSLLKDIPHWQYNDLVSYVNFQRFSLQGNVNLIGIFKKDSRLSLDISPEISAVRTKSRLRGYLLDYDESLNKIRGEKRTGTSKASWHFGYGAEAALGWDFNDGNTIQLFGSTTYLNGKRIDAMPQSTNPSTNKFDHYENLLWETGFKYIYRF